jgi:rhodanese-related sulfurtransferase
MTKTIQPGELADLLRNGKRINLIDVRTPVEFQALHLNAARNVPLDRLNPEPLFTQYSGEPLYVICQKGGRARQASERLTAAGLKHVVIVEGGTDACAAAGLPVEYERKVVSLERQVRISAGSLVVIGSALAWAVHPAFAALAAFVGAGLVFSGVTDTCGMAMLLARMPWNQLHSVACNASPNAHRAAENLR